MTDLTPNDLSHLSDEEFMALCPQGEHAPGREPLSPAAQAVLDAFNGFYELTNRRLKIAAALRAVADHIRYTDQLGLTGYGGHAQAQDQILAIADELEGSNA